MFTAATRISFASSFLSSSISEYNGVKSIRGISSAVQSLGGVFKTSRNTGPYAVVSSNFVVDGGTVEVDDILISWICMIPIKRRCVLRGKEVPKPSR